MSRSIKCSVFFLVFGAVLIVLGCVFIPVFHNMIHDEIKTQIPLKVGSTSYNNWLDPPVPIYFQVWVFDLVNPLEVTQQGATPAVVQKGPYTYREHRHKVNITFNENGTVAYKEKRSFTFDRQKSAGPESDTFTTVNLPMITIAELIRYEYGWLQGFVDALLEAAGDAELFLKLSIGDILWGYEDALMKSVKEIAERFNHTLPDEFGLFYNTNGSDDGLYTIFTGSDVHGIDKFNIIDKWDSKKSLGYWNTGLCDMINGTDGTMFPPFVDKSDKLYIFSTDICRSIYATYEKETKLKGINLYHFTVPPRVFERASLNENNAGFCTPPGNCLPSGVLNISVCKSGAPVVISNPHFLQADKQIIDAVIGIHPNIKEHQTILDVDPLTGVVMNAEKKLQLNAFLQKVDNFRSTENIKDTIFPIMWLNESALIDDKSANEYKSGLMTPIRITQAVQYGLIVIGAFLFICAMAFLIKHKMTHKKEDVLVDIPNERLTNDRLPTERTNLIQS